MSEFRDLLNRKADDFRPAEDGLDRTIDRADRRHKSHRITSAVVALIVAVVGGVGAYQMLGGGTRTITPGDDGIAATDWRGIYPYDNRADAEISQARADRGDPRVTNELDLTQMVWHFHFEVLGWSHYSVEEQPAFAVEGTDRIGPDETAPITISLADPDESGPLEVKVNTTCNASPFDPTVQEQRTDGCATSSAVITFERLLRRDRTGIWAVTKVVVDGQSVKTGVSPLPPVDTPQPGDPTSGDGSPTVGAEMPTEVDELVTKFMDARRADDQAAEEHLAPDALAAYDSNEGGLDLYAYMTGGEITWGVSGWRNVPDTDRWDVTVVIEGNTDAFPDSGIIHETLRVGSPGDGAPYKILEAQRNE
jgi:hypothetical protein